MNKIPMTKEGYVKLQEELKKLTSEDRPNIIAAIAEARGHGDLSENAEYQYAKGQQSLIEGKIADLESTISRAEVIDVKSIASEEVKFGGGKNSYNYSFSKHCLEFIVIANQPISG